MNTRHNYCDIIEPLLVTHDLWTSDNLAIGKAFLDALNTCTAYTVKLVDLKIDPNYCTASQYKEIKSVEKDIDKYERSALVVFGRLYEEAKETIGKLIAQHIDPVSNVIYIVVLPPTYERHVCLNKKILVKYGINKKDVKNLVTGNIISSKGYPILSIGTIDEYKDYLKSLLDKYQSTTFQDHIDTLSWSSINISVLLDACSANLRSFINLESLDLSKAKFEVYRVSEDDLQPYGDNLIKDSDSSLSIGIGPNSTVVGENIRILGCRCAEVSHEAVDTEPLKIASVDAKQTRALLDRFPVVTNFPPEIRKLLEERMALIAGHCGSLLSPDRLADRDNSSTVEVFDQTSSNVIIVNPYHDKTKCKLRHVTTKDLKVHYEDESVATTVGPEEPPSHRPVFLISENQTNPVPDMVRVKIQHVTTEDLKAYNDSSNKAYEAIRRGIPIEPEIEPLKVESISGWAKAGEFSKTVYIDDVSFTKLFPGEDYRTI